MIENVNLIKKNRDRIQKMGNKMENENLKNSKIRINIIVIAKCVFNMPLNLLITFDGLNSTGRKDLLVDLIISAVHNNQTMLESELIT